MQAGDAQFPRDQIKAETRPVDRCVPTGTTSAEKSIWSTGVDDETLDEYCQD